MDKLDFLKERKNLIFGPLLLAAKRNSTEFSPFITMVTWRATEAFSWIFYLPSIFWEVLLARYL